jgi:hypothetical protein
MRAWVALSVGAVSIAIGLVGPWGGVADAQRQTRPFPDTSDGIAILVDQLPGRMTEAQQRFAARRFVGSQKLTLDISRALRAYNPAFLVLHYRLAIWQSAPTTPYVVDGRSWGNDFPEVSRHEDWFWHNPMGARVTSSLDGKFLLNVGNGDLAQYWSASTIAQAEACECDAVFADSASPALLQWQANTPPEPRFARTGVRDAQLPELQGRTFIQAWTDFMTRIDAALAARGLTFIPNVGQLITTWDTTPYEVASGAFVEGFASPEYAVEDWQASVSRMLQMVALDKVVILQNYLPSSSDVARRRYYLATYLLVKGRRTYLDYFASGPFEWYPEWDVDLGRARTSARRVEDLAEGGVYRREFERGVVLVNPTDHPSTVTFESPLRRVIPEGGGAIGQDGAAPGRLLAELVTRITVPARSAEILLR